MLKIAYLANQFPSPVEPYVTEEIDELRRRGVEVLAGTVWKPKRQLAEGSSQSESVSILALEPIRLIVLFQAICLLIRRWKRISRFVKRALVQGKESPSRRLKAILHTLLGAYYAVLLQKHDVDHVHVHHGYFGSWIGMVAASLLGIEFSLTLHGSDLLIHDAYLDTKLKNCRFCITISDYNRSYMSKRFPEVDRQKIIVSRLGVDTKAKMAIPFLHRRTKRGEFNMLSAGRLHVVKNHAFLILACARLRDVGVSFKCSIAGAGPELKRLETLIQENRLQECVKLVGHVVHSDIDFLYRSADLFVMTSISEGIPLVLMEAMTRGTIVLAPDITGIPELVIPGKTGFLYQPGNLEDFVHRILFLQKLLDEDPSQNRLPWIRHAGEAQVRNNFSRSNNLWRFGATFVKQVLGTGTELGRAHSLLQ